jgi:hypothetical protein
MLLSRLRKISMIRKEATAYTQIFMVNQKRSDFSYSSGNFSSMYFLMLA